MNAGAQQTPSLSKTNLYKDKTVCPISQQSVRIVELLAKS